MRVYVCKYEKIVKRNGHHKTVKTMRYDGKSNEQTNDQADESNPASQITN